MTSSRRNPQTRRRVAETVAWATPSDLATGASDEVPDRLQHSPHYLAGHASGESGEERDHQNELDGCLEPHRDAPYEACRLAPAESMRVARKATPERSPIAQGWAVSPTSFSAVPWAMPFGSPATLTEITSAPPSDRATT